MAVRAGTRLGPYEILSAIGAGGMGEVYRARDTKLGRDVAFKVLPAAFAADSERMARFEREARLLAALNHPNIASIYGLEESSGTPALVMELVEGPTLADRIAAGPIPLDEALPIATQIAEALEYAHEKGIVHRDLKPANIKVKADGTVKVLDFGLAKALTDDPSTMDMSNSPTLSMGATVAGVILGTAAYMSPEQAKAKPADRRADIWAFGVVLYEMLTGKRLYTGENAAETLASVIKEEPSFDCLPPTTPPAIRNLLRRCLEKNVRQRLQHIGEARIAIENADAAPAETALTQHKSRERILEAIAAVAVAASLALGATLLLQKPEAMMPLETTLLPPKDHTFYGSDFAISPDGKKIVFVARDSSTQNVMLWIRQLDSTTAQLLAGTDGARYPFWSPDSKFIAFFAGDNLAKIDPGGGPVLRLSDLGIGTSPRGGSWGEDGTIVFSRGVTGGGLYQVSSNGGPVSLLTHYDADRGENDHRWPFFLPDGRHLLFGAAVPDTSQGGIVQEIRVLDLKTKKQSVLLQADSGAQYADGYLFYIQQGNLLAQHLDLSSLTLSGGPIPLAQHVQVLGQYALGAFSASPNGLLAFMEGDTATSKLAWYTRDGKETGQLGSPAPYNIVSLSPDGTKAATSLGDAQGKRRDIWVFEVARGTATRVTVDGVGADDPVWGNDGTKVFYRDTVHGIGIYANSTSGLSRSELVEQMQAEAVPNGISPDGKFLVYMNFGGQRGPRIWIHPFAPAKPEAKDYPLLGTNFNEAHGQFSPDGHWLAYESDETGKEQVYVVPFPNPSNKAQISASGGSQPRWRRDGKEIYFISPDGKMMAVVVEILGNSIKPDIPKALFQTRIITVSRGYHQYDVTADGQKFLINSSVEQNPEPITLYVNWTAGLKK